MTARHSPQPPPARRRFAADVKGWFAKLAPELKTRLYQRSDVRLYGNGTKGDPICAELVLEIGWRVNDSSDYDHTFSVVDEDGKNITAEHLTSALRDRVVRCYCEACLVESSLDDERMTRIKTVLELRRAVAKANRIPLNGSAENEAKLDEILNPGKEP